MKAQIRQQIHIKNGLTYSANKLYELAENLPVVELQLSEFSVDFDEPLWKDESQNPVVKYSMNDVLRRKDTNTFFKDHYNRALGSDLSIPILIDGEVNRVVDGYHRLLKAKIGGKDSIRAKIFESLPKEAIVS